MHTVSMVKGKRMNKEPEYIVKKSQIMNAVRYAIECSISKTEIVDLLMKDVDREISTILEDDCEEMTDEMWSSLMV